MAGEFYRRHAPIDDAHVPVWHAADAGGPVHHFLTADIDVLVGDDEDLSVALGLDVRINRQLKNA